MPDQQLVFRDYLIEPVFGRMTPSVASDVAGFWLANGAIADSTEAERRTAEVVCVARDGSGAVVGVNSVYVGAFERADQAYYFYRMFIRGADRIRGLGARMTTAAVDCLREHVLRTGAAVAGIVLVTENPKLMLPGAQGLLTRLGWKYLGRGPLGRDVWKIDFTPVEKVTG